MRGGTVCIIYFQKVLELLYLAILTVFIIVETALLYPKLEDNPILIILLSVMLVLVVYHFLYVNLLTNMRFKVKMANPACSKWVFEYVNALLCF